MKRSEHTDELSATASDKISDSPCHDPTHKADPPLILTLLGGDARQFSVAAALADVGYEVRLMGLGEAEDGGLSPPCARPMPPGIRIYHRLDRVLEGCGGIVLPYPATKDGHTVFCPLDTQHTLSLDDIAAHAEKHPWIKLFGGRMPKPWVGRLRHGGCSVTEYEDSEAFLIRNARLTAEGAVMTAMTLTDTALLRTPVAVIGFGRIGRFLGGLLAAMGAEVTVFARRKESLAEAEAAGYRAVGTNRIHHLCEGFEVIFNTVPVPLVTREVLTALPCHVKIIELASAPGGLDPDGVSEATRRCGLQVIRAPSLPGRYAPVDAGRAIADCILSELVGEVSL